MKKLYFLLVLLLLFLSSCRRSPEAMAENYMHLHCKVEKLYNELDDEESERRQTKTKKRIAKLTKKMEKANRRILSKYQGDADAMEKIHVIVVNHDCSK